MPRTKDPSKAQAATWDKLKDAPSLNLPFPATGNITAVELLTFLPSTLKSWDVIERFISNGANTPTLAYIINTNRDMPSGQIAFNSVLRLMQTAVRTRTEDRYKGWTVLKHTQPEGWDERTIGLGVGGFRTPAKTHPRKHEKWNEQPGSTLFKDLAKGLKGMPEGNDALDLTRCVLYHQAHPQEVWYYPDQFEELVKHLGGPATVTDEHLDSRAFARWARLRKSAGTASRATTVEVEEEAADVSEKVTSSDEDEAADVPEKVAPSDEDEADDGAVDEVKDMANPRKATIKYETDSEQEELVQSWKNWKEHGIEGLYMPIKKRG